MANSSSARPLWYLVLSVVGLGISIAYWYPRMDPSLREGWLRMARQLELVVTGGSDFHGEAMPEVAQPGIELPEPHAARLCDWLGVLPS